MDSIWKIVPWRDSTSHESKIAATKLSIVAISLETVWDFCNPSIFDRKPFWDNICMFTVSAVIQMVSQTRTNEL